MMQGYSSRGSGVNCGLHEIAIVSEIDAVHTEAIWLGDRMKCIHRASDIGQVL
jgi:hypothetical protein